MCVNPVISNQNTQIPQLRLDGQNLCSCNDSDHFTATLTMHSCHLVDFNPLNYSTKAQTKFSSLTFDTSKFTVLFCHHSHVHLLLGTRMRRVSLAHIKSMVQVWSATEACLGHVETYELKCAFEKLQTLARCWSLYLPPRWHGVVTSLFFHFILSLPSFCCHCHTLVVLC